MGSSESVRSGSRFLAGAHGSTFNVDPADPAPDSLSKDWFPFVDATPEVLEHASSYFHIRIWAAPATLSLMVVQGWFIGIQNARTPMMLTIAVNVFNILGNLIFVYGFGMNSDGVAYGMVCAQYLGLLIAFKILSTMVSPLKNPVNWRKVLQLSALKQYFYINFDLFLRTLNLIVVFAFFTLASSWQSGVILAANSILMQPWAFTLLPSTALLTRPKAC